MLSKEECEKVLREMGEAIIDGLAYGCTQPIFKNVILPKEWVPFTLDEDGMLNCPLPDEEEEILISDGKSVWIDTLMEDNGYYLDSGCEFQRIGMDAVA